MVCIKTKVKHSLSKTAWNVVGTQLGEKYKIACVPYFVVEGNEILTTRNKHEALEHALFISRCLSGLRTEDKVDICFWEEVDTGEYYESGCNKKGFQFNDGSPYDNGFKFCPYCGKQLKIKKPIFDDIT